MIGKLALNPQTFFWGVVIALVLGLGSGIGGTWYVRGLQIDAIEARHDADTAKMATKVAVAEGETTKVRLEFQTNMGNYKNALDQEYITRVTSLNDSVTKLAGIRLRDPSAGGNSGSSSGNGSSQGNNGSSTNGGELLSPETSAFLWSLAGESQGYLDRLNQCKAWNAKLSEEQQKYYDEIIKLKAELAKKD